MTTTDTHTAMTTRVTGMTKRNTRTITKTTDTPTDMTTMATHTDMTITVTHSDMTIMATRTVAETLARMVTRILIMDTVTTLPPW